MPNVRNENTAAKTLHRLMETTMSGEDVNKILRGFADVGGPAGLRLDEHGACPLLVDDGRLITLLHIPPLPVLTVIVPLLDTDKPTRSLQNKLLAANGSWRITGGGIFARPAAEDILVYCRHVELAGADPGACLEALKQVMRFVRELEIDIQLFIDLPEATKGLSDAGRRPQA